jgi:hypothetical protein
MSTRGKREERGGARINECLFWWGFWMECYYFSDSR